MTTNHHDGRGLFDIHSGHLHRGDDGDEIVTTVEAHEPRPPGAIGSAAMSYAAADDASPRSVIAYTAAPIFLAIVVDRVIAVIRRHVLADAEASPWTPLGRLVRGIARACAIIALYTLRFFLDPSRTGRGLRLMVLDAAPVPQARTVTVYNPPGNLQFVLPTGVTKKAALLALYAQHRDHGDRSKVGPVAAELGPKAGLQAGTARTYLYDYLDSQAS